MRIYKDESFIEFDFWGGAKDNVAFLTDDEEQQIFDWLEELCAGEAMEETQINDYFWFETDQIAEQLGYDDWEFLLNDRK